MLEYIGLNKKQINFTCSSLLLNVATTKFKIIFLLDSTAVEESIHQPFLIVVYL